MVRRSRRRCEPVPAIVCPVPASAAGHEADEHPRHGAERITKRDRLPLMAAECQAGVDLRPVVPGCARRSGACVV